MFTVNRENIEDAKIIVENLIPNESIRNFILNFVANEIIFAHKMKKNNWNLNLDKHGNFLRFNTGHEYCIQISKKSVLILCIRNLLKEFIDNENHKILFQGYSGKNKVISKKISEIPDCLVKVPNSIGCIIQHKDIQEYISQIESANKSFIEFAITNTSMLPVMKFAHSPGAIEYIKKHTQKDVPIPIYNLSSEELQRFEEKSKEEVKKLSFEELQKKIKGKSKISQKAIINSEQYLRDPYVSEYIKRKANGICQDCGKPAPFVNKKTGEPFLEIHHIIPLSKGGSDTIDNVIALCPNCHRKRHYG